ncbi:MAG TPA: saccharopine dehydrogenase NADP-binding domain-containing protein [Thermoleophilia bacterium]|nr:saccharopine dehydrogenase NADP-binding domain-containing protein [Thermoleophilia bacterium]HQG54461.1 saccharopine dehydrogenase NADP-binding domain-containing protein [Thermoleophilia bacterium]
MKVLQLGVGAVGEVNARVAAQEPHVSTVVLADIDEARVRAVAAKLPPGKAQCLVLDASDRAALVDAAKDAGFVLNALATAWDIPVMEACLEAGANYLDMGTGGPREITGTADLDEQLALDGEFKRRGLTAMVSFGIDPGASDVFAHALYDEFDAVTALTVLDGDNGTADGYEFVCSFSPETMIEECLLPPYVFRDGRESRNEALSVSREFEFPAPVGRLRLWNVDHEEAQLMPQFLGGKGLRDAAFFIALDDRFVEALRVFRYLGLNQRAPVEFRGARFSPLQFVASRLPQPAELAGKIHGAVCVGALCEGTLAGRPARRFMYQTTSHDEAWERLGVQGTAWQTGASAACAVRLFARGEVARRGVVPPELLDPAPFIAEMRAVGLEVGVVDLPVA